MAYPNMLNQGGDPYNMQGSQMQPPPDPRGQGPFPQIGASAPEDLFNEHDANLQLADAFHGLGDHASAASALAPVLAGGSPVQQTAAQKMIGQLQLQGGDPRNMTMGVPNNEEAEEAVPPNIAMVIRAMHNAYSNKGTNPYNSHPDQAAKWERAWKEKAGRDAAKQAKLVDKFKSIADRYEKTKKVGSAAVPKAKDQPNYTEGKDYASNLTSPKSNTAGPTVRVRKAPNIKR